MNNMGMRKDSIVAIKESIDGLVTDSGRVIHAVNTYFDPLQLPAGDANFGLPKFSVTADPQTIAIGLFGTSRDAVLRIGVIGYTYTSENNELFLEAEDIVALIVNKLTTQERAEYFRGLSANCGFSIIEMGPILVDQFDETGNMAFISIPITVQFIDKVF